MTSVWGGPAPQGADGNAQKTRRRAMGAEDRRKWSSFARQDVIASTMEQLANSKVYGVAIIGPRGVGKTTLAHAVEARLHSSTHVINLFGTGSGAEAPYGAFSLLMARLSEYQSESPTMILQKLTKLMAQDSQGRPTVIMLDDLPGVDTASTGVLIQLLLSGTAKLMVMARSLSELPDDLVWMIKDGLLASARLSDFTRAEVRMLLGRALQGSVAESVVSSLHNLSAGNPLALEALVRENLARGALRQHGGVWVLEGPEREATDNILVELVESRLARLPGPARTGLEKLALLRTAPFSVVMHALSPEVVSELEERGFLSVSSGLNGMVAFTEPYIAETLRGQLSRVDRALLFDEMAGILALDPATMDKQQLLAFAAWANDAGMALNPKVALAAAQAAVQYLDPQLALACTVQIRPGHLLGVQAAQIRSRAYNILANYTKAVASLQDVDAEALAALPLTAYASWAVDLAAALLWVPGGYARIEVLLANLSWRIDHADIDDDLKQAEKYLQLARFEFQVHRGEFAQVTQELTDCSQDPSDRKFRLNCASLLVLVFAVTGRELDAIDLYETISLEVEEHDLVLRMRDWNMHGLVLALTWTGQWRACESTLTAATELSSGLTQHRGAVMELALGIAYVYAGRGTQAADVLLVAAAQLEVRDTYNSLKLVYSALAFSFAQIDDAPNAHRYLAKAQGIDPCTLWVNRYMTEFFQLMALRWLDDPSAAAKLLASAESDIAKGRFSTASMSLFGATTYGKDGQFRLLEETSLKRQGPMAAVNVALARAHRTRNPSLALKAAEIARDLELAAVESRCLVVALELSRNAGEMGLCREAQRRLDLLMPQVPVLPLVPNNAAVPLTTRERQITALAARGMANREIAARIGVSIRTVEGHLYQVFAKMGITSRSELEQETKL